MAMLTGWFHAGDAILQVDDTSMAGLEHDQVISLLRSKSNVMLIVAEVAAVSAKRPMLCLPSFHCRGVCRTCRCQTYLASAR